MMMMMMMKKHKQNRLRFQEAPDSQEYSSFWDLEAGEGFV
jgi:hypothetical protein